MRAHHDALRCADRSTDVCASCILGNHRISVIVARKPKCGTFGMPYYTFDLVVGNEFRNQGTIILEDLHVASDRADQLADELSHVKPELKAKGCAVRVIDVNRRELYRTPLDSV